MFKMLITRLPMMALLMLVLINCSPEKQSSAETELYVEDWRPQFHFTPERNWMNDPNGMVYYEGEYHLFYQYYPDSNVWGPMHWGHAVSKDMVRWEHLPVALYPDSLGYIFSGSAVIDYNNTSGLGSANQAPMIAIFTYHAPDAEKNHSSEFQYQGIAFSLDKGRTWTKYSGNPVLRKTGQHDFRDPKVFRHEPSHQWVMIVSVNDHVEFYGSPDLIEWKYLSEFGKNAGAHGGVWECPDLFEMSVEGTPEKKWVLLLNINPGAFNGGSGTQYFIGQFNGREFKAEMTDTLWLDYGKDNYAGVTWSNVPAADGRRLFLGWMSNWQYGTVVPTTRWRSAMTVPRTLRLVKSESGLRMASNPVTELETLREGNADEYADVIIASDTVSREIPLPGSQLQVEIEINRDDQQKDFEFELSNEKGEKVRIGLNAATNQFYIDRTHSGRVEFSPDFPGIHKGNRSSTATDTKLTLFIDAASIEMFADGGTLTMTELFFPTSPYRILRVRAAGRGVNVKSIRIFTLKSIWKDKTVK